MKTFILNKLACGLTAAVMLSSSGSMALAAAMPKAGPGYPMVHKPAAANVRVTAARTPAMSVHNPATGVSMAKLPANVVRIYPSKASSSINRTSSASANAGARTLATRNPVAGIGPRIVADKTRSGPQTGRATRDRDALRNALATAAATGPTGGLPISTQRYPIAGQKNPLKWQSEGYQGDKLNGSGGVAPGSTAGGDSGYSGSDTEGWIFNNLWTESRRYLCRFENERGGSVCVNILNWWKNVNSPDGIGRTRDGDVIRVSPPGGNGNGNGNNGSGGNGNKNP
jgi:hypothetical protein